ncbi:MAG: hypothetical protein O7G85_09690 [Planctomycetota bacterium]|nr:hypothetical protein [Planctomycetota bacterium]
MKRNCFKCGRRIENAQNGPCPGCGAERTLRTLIQSRLGFAILLFLMVSTIGILLQVGVSLASRETTGEAYYFDFMLIVLLDAPALLVGGSIERGTILYTGGLLYVIYAELIAFGYLKRRLVFIFPAIVLFHGVAIPMALAKAGMGMSMVFRLHDVASHYDWFVPTVYLFYALPVLVIVFAIATRRVGRLPIEGSESDQSIEPKTPD